MNPRVDVLDGGLRRLAARARFQDPRNDGGDNQHTEDADPEPHELAIDGEAHARRRARSAARARTRKAPQASPGSTFSGVPEVTEASSGTGRASPLGRRRLRFSR